MKVPERQQDRIERLMNNRLDKIRLGDNCTAEVTGYGIVPYPPPPGKPASFGWYVGVLLAHNKLIGQPPIEVIVPLPNGLAPEEGFLDNVTDQLLEQCRTLREEANNPKKPDAAKMMAELQAQNGQSPQ